MFGNKWEPAQGTVAEYRPDEMALAGAVDQSPVHVYVLDVRKPGGGTMRATVRGSAGVPLAIGTVVRVEFHPKSGAIRFDASAPPLGVGGTARHGSISSAADAIKLAEQVKAQMAAGGPAAVVAAFAGTELAQPAGQQAPGVLSVGGPEAAELMQAMLSGDPGQKAAAVARLRELRPGAAGQAGHPADPVSSPGSPAPINPAGAFSVPAEPASFSPPGSPSAPPAPAAFDQPVSFSPPGSPSARPAPAAFDQPASFSPPPAPAAFDQPASFSPPSFDQAGSFSVPAPPSFDQVSSFGTPGSFGAPATPSSFDQASAFAGPGSAGQGSAADRIARLQELRDKGLITAAEFEAQRQRILDDI